MATILVVDDNFVIREVIATLVEPEGYNVWHAATGEEAVELLKGPPAFDLVIVDIFLPGMSGVQVLEEVTEHRPGTPTIAMSGYVTAESTSLVDRLEALGVSRIIGKPFSQEAILTAIQGALPE